MKLTTIIAILGILLSITLLLQHGTETDKFCDFNDKFSCTIVDQSTYSEFLNYPISLYGLLYYAIILTGAGAYLLKKHKLIGIMLGLTSLALMSSIILTVIEIIKIKSVCILCLISLILILIIFWRLIKMFDKEEKDFLEQQEVPKKLSRKERRELKKQQNGKVPKNEDLFEQLKEIRDVIGVLAKRVKQLEPKQEITEMPKATHTEAIKFLEELARWGEQTEDPHFAEFIRGLIDDQRCDTGTVQEKSE